MSKDRASILVVDDAADTLEVLERSLTSAKHRVFTASNVTDAIALLDVESVDLVITDQKMPKVSGLDLVRYVRENRPDTEVMMITGYANIQGAVEAVKTGAEEYLAKPFTDEELFNAVDRSLVKLRRRRMAESQETQPPGASHGIIGESAVIRDKVERARNSWPGPFTIVVIVPQLRS
jgi:DNA-binding NtrC family response regulator